MILNHSIVFLALLLVSLIYYRLAKKFNIVDKPNQRSSHSEVTVRGGGIIFPLAIIFWWIVFDFSHSWMVLGLVLISSVSFLDDIYSLSRKLRFGTQFIALSMSFYDLGVFAKEPLWSLPILYFIALGIINAINFMDGINGITGLYHVVFFGSILAVNQYFPIFEGEMIQYIILGILVFLIFNLKKRALMFAGDIGSISLAYLVIYFLTQWYLTAENWTIILFLIVYGVDSFLTLGQRLLKRENVTQPHRAHLYQLFANQLKIGHVTIAIVFSLAQFLVNFLFFILPGGYPSGLVAGISLIAFAAIYLILKISIQRKFGLT
ncbi:MAG: UDP-N-acetylmuramyl pentapeptide phosphotransferase/UDP-N-acetylglucosamine-1-phosphate transferase [Algoriphagus sp.]|jgi:UDP-N-acetylmuramyl pentapeptide phosphotransferase/UDP-N-acetylglucosamine-1-phosphate transferase